MRPNLTSAMKTAVAAKTVHAVLLCQLSFASGIVYAWTGLGNLVWGGNTYLGVGTFGGISSASESTNIRATNVTLSLSGIPSDLVALLIGDEYQGRPAKVWFGLVDTSNTIVVDPILVFGGSMDTCQISDTGQTSTISVSVENQLIDLQNPRQRRFTDQDQQFQYPGDNGLQYVAAIQNLNITWGAPTPASMASGPATPVRPRAHG